MGLAKPLLCAQPLAGIMDMRKNRALLASLHDAGGVSLQFCLPPHRLGDSADMAGACPGSHHHPCFRVFAFCLVLGREAAAEGGTWLR